MADSASAASRSRDLGVAMAVAALVVGGEYFFRHDVMFWLPVFATLAVNDALAMLLGYALLLAAIGASLRVDWRHELAEIGRCVREGLTRWSFTLWVLALLVGVWALSAVDRLLWGRVALPMLVSAHRNPAVWLAGFAPVLKPLAFVFVNGFFVPVAEEFLWRGLVQARLLRVLPASLAIGTTAVLFSLKHALVDASLGRLLALIAFGAVTGVVAWRQGWRHSAALHVVVNTIATVVGLVFGLG